MSAQALHDILAPGLKVLFVGINPGLVSARAGHNLPNPRNCFWRALHHAGLTPTVLAPEDETQLLDHGLGLTNSVARATAGSGDLRAADFEGALNRLTALAERLTPGWVAFVGKDACAPLFRPRRAVSLGVQKFRIGPARVFVLPSTSPANAVLSEAQKLAWFTKLARRVASTSGDDYLRPRLNVQSGASRMGDTPTPETTAAENQVSDDTEPADPLKALLDAKEAAEKQALEFKDKLLRTAAEFENYKKRAKKEIEDAQHMGRERLLKELLGVADNVTLALQHIPDDNAASKGVKLVEKQLMQTLEKFGLKRFSALGQPFDPNLHEAVQQVDTHDATADTVVQEFACGYTYQDRLFRPAMVAVARSPGASA